MSGDPRTDVCAHCGVEVRTINYALGAELMHSPYPHHPRNAYRFCHLQVAALAAPLAGQHATDEEADRG